MTTTSQEPNRKRRWFQIGLRLALIVVLCWIGLRLQRARANRDRMTAVAKTVAAIEELSYKFKGKHDEQRPRTWLENLFDDPGGADDPVHVLAVTRGRRQRDTAEDARQSLVKFNLHTLRAQIQLYKAQHEGRLPSADLSELTKGTNLDGSDGTKFGPYMQSIPVNGLTDMTSVKSITAATVAAGDVTGGGWIYSTTSGNIWIDHEDFWTE